MNLILDAASTKWNFIRFSPGLVGGHCIPVDPYYLVYKANEIGYHPQVILAGRAINDYIRYEHLEEDLKRICGILGLEYNSKYLLHYKKRDRKPFSITEESKNLIREKFSHELIDFGYEVK